ncbi:MAG: hypothetical protein GIW94_15760 [Candidatus Eremiobacteraeota bacterium]|nr:hypothetical protein [Candidatus Eremiobacteraeota bacterium]MBC5822167.1 hypothetical protein [Candidatus Eremiobacteraeota bacterium]
MADRGFRFEVRDGRLHVFPEPEPKVVARLREVKSELRAFIAEHGGTWPPLAGSHRYVVWSGALALRANLPATFAPVVVRFVDRKRRFYHDPDYAAVGSWDDLFDALRER